MPSGGTCVRDWERDSGDQANTGFREFQRDYEDIQKNVEGVAENQTEDIAEEIQTAIAVVMDQSAG